MNMQETTKNFLNDAWWLEEIQFQPLKTMLLLLAAELDQNYMTSTAGEYNRAYRHALSLRPDARPEIDPLEEMLTRGAFGN